MASQNPAQSTCPHCGLTNPGPEHMSYAPALCAERRHVMGDGGPCLSCGGNDGYGSAPHHKPDCYFASTEDASHAA